MKVLIIDDDQSFATVVTTALEKAGFQTVSAATAEEGLNKAKAELPNIILCDQILPDISGNKIVEQLKAEDATKNIPILLLSNFSQQELVTGAIQAGATDYVFKYQVEPQDIINKINEVLKTNQPVGGPSSNTDQTGQQQS
ncbi:MAG TPA: response regulator [Candidatus Saccharimonadales bacterium]|nr:response regulator [Candidatus Saccharimonadales bacterium]